ncbi:MULTISPECIES: phosphate butyryltransferase [Psychrilyobacter]|uniref:Phosphate butyryltransferase n=1 Tax=Psychrilyobacter piezotolerans TaxID=2293438 RepID=A0ABX9KJT2_9FUSO|nr:MULTISPECIES: phosphate butyryltransferase [Psychrilyobacter]MCS5420851.1 phosphate butyryltransferase [Psychrilyobacter sp. S5]NDI76829.1 phosphate butyryltransferase [Psychrilyobacter piezotolerans]RDE65109.1 phosphate butyryltransferase [Psychrilyobacter sp. S5]REI42679.1 phosphate butyryltransferase [Psychrilyobacter piezotolerans]
MKNFQEILAKAQQQGEKKVISVAVAQDREVLLSVEEARKKGVVDGILVGDSAKIEKVADELNIDLSNYKVIDKKDDVEAARQAVIEVSSGRADMLMKGLVDTSVVLKAALDREIGLRGDGILSHVAVFEIENYDRLFFITDAAMNIAPDLEAKKKIIDNSVKVARALDIEIPKVACICAKEKMNPKMPDTVDAHELEEMSKRGEIENCIVGGPFALDNAVSIEAAKHKGIEHEVAGMADILLAPDIEGGNILYKSISYFARSKGAGLIVGAAAPIILTSRADSEETKLNSIILGAMTAGKL